MRSSSCSTRLRWSRCSKAPTLRRMNTAPASMINIGKEEIRNSVVVIPASDSRRKVFKVPRERPKQTVQSAYRNRRNSCRSGGEPRDPPCVSTRGGRQARVMGGGVPCQRPHQLALCGMPSPGASPNGAAGDDVPQIAIPCGSPRCCTFDGRAGGAGGAGSTRGDRRSRVREGGPRAARVGTCASPENEPTSCPEALPSCAALLS